MAVSYNLMTMQQLNANMVLPCTWHTWLIRMGFDQLVLCAAEKAAEFLGYEGLKEHQRQIILEIMKKRDVVLCDFIGYYRFPTTYTHYPQTNYST